MCIYIYTHIHTQICIYIYINIQIPLSLSLLPLAITISKISKEAEGEQVAGIVDEDPTGPTIATTYDTE